MQRCVVCSALRKTESNPVVFVTKAPAITPLGKAKGG